MGLKLKGLKQLDEAQVRGREGTRMISGESKREREKERQKDKEKQRDRDRENREIEREVIGRD